MKYLFLGVIGLLTIGFFTNGLNNGTSNNVCSFSKDSMVVVMRMERKVKPENVAFLKRSFDECKAAVLAKEPGCLV
jgi:hypothetical protein